MTLRLYNSLTRQTEDFVPGDPRRVTMYVCGPTVYDTPHLGNARPAVVFDTLYRILLSRYPRIDYVRNITDIDDKIMARAKANGESIHALTERTTQDYREVMFRLHVVPPTFEPLATQHVDHMVEMIGWLIAEGYAYEAQGHVLFELATFPEHGRLSGHAQEDLLAGHRVEPASYKRAPGDFVLWKPSSEDQPGWLSPWGRGRPGWHIECSAMISRLLGDTIDIHGGGADLRFPHHECELTQSTAANGRPLARYWLHNGMLQAGGGKMAKSEGNFVTVRDLLAEYPGEVIRFALLSTHYRSPLDWSPHVLAVARRVIAHWYRLLDMYLAEEASPQHNALAEPFVNALTDDLNTPRAIQELHRLFDLLPAGNDKRQVLSAILYAGSMLGILQTRPAHYLQGDKGLDADIQALFDAMRDARARRDFATSDAIRDQLLAMGYRIENSKLNSNEETIWRRE